MINYSSVLTLILLLTTMFVNGKNLVDNQYSAFGIGDSLVSLIDKYSNENTSSKESEGLLRDVKTMINQVPSNDGKSIGYHLLGAAYQEAGMNDSALSYYDKAIELTAIDSISIEAVYSKARLLDDLNNLDSSIVYYQKGIDYSNQKNIQHRQGDFHYYLGRVHNYLGQNKPALQHILLSKHYYDSIDSKENQWHVYNILGIIYEETA